MKSEVANYLPIYIIYVNYNGFPYYVGAVLYCMQPSEF